MNLADIIALAKQGYKPSDIKELIALAPAEPSEPEAQAEPTEPEAPAEPTEPEAPTEPTEPTEPDYKKLYEEAQAKVKALQLANTKKDVSSEDDKQSDEELFTDLVKNFM